jgi:hypothetical protein
MTIYVPDDLKARIDQFPEKRIWSRVAQDAFEAELNRRNAIKESNTMNDVIERLRASKLEQTRVDREAGWHAGVEWAKQIAEYADLKRAAAANELVGSASDPISDDDGDGSDPATDLYVAAYDDDARDYGDVKEFVEIAFGPDAEPSADACRGFLKGAASVWAEVKGHL